VFGEDGGDISIIKINLLEKNKIVVILVLEILKKANIYVDEFVYYIVLLNN
jgi:hypothetical protein